MGNSKGLGDVIEKITEKTGIKKAVKKLFDDDCGCDKRKEQLNKLFPYNKLECLKEAEHSTLKKFYEPRKPPVVNSEQQAQLLKIYNRVLNKKQDLSNCPSCVRNMVRELERIYLQYKE